MDGHQRQYDSFLTIKIRADCRISQYGKFWGLQRKFESLRILSTSLCNVMETMAKYLRYLVSNETFLTFTVYGNGSQPTCQSIFDCKSPKKHQQKLYSNWRYYARRRGNKGRRDADSSCHWSVALAAHVDGAEQHGTGAVRRDVRVHDCLQFFEVGIPGILQSCTSVNVFICLNNV